MSQDKVDANFRLWTIQDAKDGDVLVCESGWTCIFKTLVNDETFSSYCFMDNTKWFCETGSECHTLKEEFIKAYNGKIHPATKEQRDILMKSMADTGYTFDFQKKELKKIEQKSDEEYNITGISSNKSQGKLGEIIKKIKHSWSEEDEVGLANAMWAIEQARTIAKDENDMGNLWYAERWLKSLKDRVQPKQEWSEKDENLFKCAIDAVKQESKVRTDGCLDEEVGEKVINWLKSIKRLKL